VGLRYCNTSKDSGRMRDGCRKGRRWHRAGIRVLEMLLPPFYNVTNLLQCDPRVTEGLKNFILIPLPQVHQIDKPNSIPPISFAIVCHAWPGCFFGRSHPRHGPHCPRLSWYRIWTDCRRLPGLPETGRATHLLEKLLIAHARCRRRIRRGGVG